MQLNASQIHYSPDNTATRAQSALLLPRQHRTNPALTTHSALPHRKLLPQKTMLRKHPQPRRSESTHINKPNQRSFVRYRKLDFTMGDGFLGTNPLKEYKRKTIRGKVRAGLDTRQGSLQLFFDKVEELEGQFVSNCHDVNFIQASEVIVKLLNYAVDFNLPEQLLRSLKMLADLYLLTDNISQAFFYYDQAREACLLLEHPQLLVESLLGLAECCGRCGIEQQGIRVLKKALQYAWIYNLDELQLRIYDQIGKLHYHMGDLQKAKQYHARHINALHQSQQSALRQLSAQRIAKSEEIHLEIRYREVSLLLLIHLKLPIKNIDQLPLPFDPSPSYDSVRSHFNINSKYFVGEDAPYAAAQLLSNNWFFQQQIEDPSLPEHNDSPKPKKFAYLDFQLNQQLRRLEGGIKKTRHKVGARSEFAVKQSLEEQIARKMKEPPLQNGWYEKILRQIKRDHRNKLLNVRDAVRIRGFNKKVIPQVEAVRDLYNAFFERWRQFGLKTAHLSA